MGTEVAYPKSQWAWAGADLDPLYQPALESCAALFPFWRDGNQNEESLIDPNHLLTITAGTARDICPWGGCSVRTTADTEHFHSTGPLQPIDASAEFSIYAVAAPDLGAAPSAIYWQRGTAQSFGILTNADETGAFVPGLVTAVIVEGGVPLTWARAANVITGEFIEVVVRNFRSTALFTLSMVINGRNYANTSGGGQAGRTPDPTQVLNLGGSGGASEGMIGQLALIAAWSRCLTDGGDIPKLQVDPLGLIRRRPPQTILHHLLGAKLVYKIGDVSGAVAARGGTTTVRKTVAVGSLGGQGRAMVLPGIKRSSTSPSGAQWAAQALLAVKRPASSPSGAATTGFALTGAIARVGATAAAAVGKFGLAGRAIRISAPSGGKQCRSGVTPGAKVAAASLGGTQSRSGFLEYGGSLSTGAAQGSQSRQVANPGRKVASYGVAGAQRSTGRLDTVRLLQGASEGSAVRSAVLVPGRRTARGGGQGAQRRTSASDTLATRRAASAGGMIRASGRTLLPRPERAGGASGAAGYSGALDPGERTAFGDGQGGQAASAATGADTMPVGSAQISSTSSVSKLAV